MSEMKEMREKRGLSQSELAKRAGVSRSMVSMIECGQRRNPSLDVMRQLAASLRVSTRWVVNAIESEPAA